MSYKSKLGIKDGILSWEIDTYFKRLGFYVTAMRPDYVDGQVYEKINMDVPSLRFDAIREDKRVNVFMNTNEVYVEHLDKLDGSLIHGGHHVFNEPPKTIEEVEDVLNKLV
ncbi:hypothetical protein [Bacillus mycoides]|uniref:hypothetical protein n=1 Tax=Bacillus mycoides TaxID=1405 RepID=UPI003A80509C